MEGLKLLKTMKRMCKYEDKTRYFKCYDGYGCPIEAHCDQACFSIDEPEELISIVEKWAEEHPEKTYKDVLLEKFPNAKACGCCVSSIFGEKHHVISCCSTTCAACWNRLYEEDNQ